MNKPAMRIRSKHLVVFMLIAIYGLVMLTGGCNNKEKDSSSIDIAEASFVGSNTCKSCHHKEYEQWSTSDHYRAMQVANDSTVLGDFSGATFEADGVKNTLFKKDGKYFINTEGKDGQYRDFEIKYTFGHYPLQQYLVEFTKGHLQATRLSWDSREGKWFHQYAGEKIPAHDFLHWTGNGQNWNTMCASCHSTDLRKNYFEQVDSFHTTFNEINVACESCHGPGSAHVALMKSGKTVKPGESGLRYGKGIAGDSQLQSCAPCHARKSDISSKALHTHEWMDDYIPQVISQEFYHADGQIREENFEYASFVQSKMYHNNVNCSNCHNPHSGRLVAEGNKLCTSCHDPKYNSATHHFHPAESTGTQCINCHMPLKTYMGNDHRRDHSFRIPRPDQSVIYKTPNACTQCHQGKSDVWAKATVEQWYGTSRTYHFSDDLLPGSLLDENSEKHLIKLLADTSQPAIARATAAQYLGEIPSPNGAQALLAASKDNQAIVRFYSLKALNYFPQEVWQREAIVCLQDAVRSVRIAAAELYHSIGGEKVMEDRHKAAYRNAYAELENYLSAQSDFAVGNVMLADHHLKSNDYAMAVYYYVRGLERDNQLNYARLNLSAAQSASGNNVGAKATLLDALEIDPENDRGYYNLALLLYEMGETEEAIVNFRKAVSLESNIIGVYYNYGLILQQQGKAKDAEYIFKKGLEKSPNALNLHYALAYTYVSENKVEQARKHIQVLYRFAPNNPEYASMFRLLGI
jgi:predicted CXXCH cytochrome family protein